MAETPGPLRCRAASDLAELSKTQIEKMVAQLEAEMRAAAKQLEFERAAAIRDEIQTIRLRVLDEDASTTVLKAAERAGREGRSAPPQPRFRERGRIGQAVGADGGAKAGRTAAVDVLGGGHAGGHEVEVCLPARSRGRRPDDHGVRGDVTGCGHGRRLAARPARRARGRRCRLDGALARPCHAESIGDAQRCQADRHPPDPRRPPPLQPAARIPPARAARASPGSPGRCAPCCSTTPSPSPPKVDG